MYDASPKAIAMIRDFCRGFPAVLDDLRRLLESQPDLHRPHQGRSACSPGRKRSTAVAAGPVARASGVTRDLRKDEPYLSYRDFDFQVCCAQAGDCFARYLVRMAEMEESLKIVRAGDREPAGRAGNVGTGRPRDPARQAPGASRPSKG